MYALICGLGSIGRRHGRNLQMLSVGRIAGFDPQQERRAAFQGEVDAEVFDDFDAALKSGPDLVIVASPNRFHVEQALAAARAGCHLLIEKPLGTSMAGVEDLRAEIERRGLFCQVGSNWKFHPAFRAMKKLVEEGAAGRIRGAQVLAGQWLPDWHPWEDYRQMYSSRRDLGGGVVFDTHEFDYLLWLLGPVADVCGQVVTSGSLEIDTEEAVAVSLRMECGAVASLLLDYIQREPRRRYHLAGDAGTIEWDLQEQAVRFFEAETKQWSSIDCRVDDLNEMYLEQMRHVLDGVAGNAVPVTPISHAQQVLDLQIRIRESNGIG